MTSWVPCCLLLDALACSLQLEVFHCVCLSLCITQPHPLIMLEATGLESKLATSSVAHEQA
jgi:hypothetical protein